MMKKIKLFDPIVGKEEEKILIKTLRSKYWASGSGIGYVSKFENSLKDEIVRRSLSFR